MLISGHPEFNQPIVEFLLENRFGKGLFGKDVFDEALPHAKDEHDGINVGEGIMKFISSMEA
jgi:hypothetical protein